MLWLVASDSQPYRSQHRPDVCISRAFALVALGKLAIDACLEAYTATTDDDTRDSIAVVLSRCATQDERIYEVLLDTLERSPDLGAMCLAEYGDPRAIRVWFSFIKVYSRL